MPVADYRQQIEAKWYTFILGYSRRLAFLARDYPSRLSVNESHVLAEIAAETGVSAKELAGRLGIEKSVLSRLLDGFQKRRLIARAPGEADRRWKRLIAAPAGLEVLEQDAAIRNFQAAMSIIPLAVGEREFFVCCMERVAEASNAPPLHRRQADNRLERALRRITRATGFLGGDFMSTGFSAAACQLLAVMAAAPGALGINEIAAALPYDRTTVSRALSRLRAAGLVQSAAPGGDRRRCLMQFTPAGRKRLKAAAARGESFALNLVLDLTAEEKHRFAGLLPSTFQPRAFSRQAPKSCLAAAPEELTRARGFLMEQLVAAGEHLDAPATLFGEGSEALLLFRGRRLAGVGELRHEGSRCLVPVVAAAAGPDRLEQTGALLKAVFCRIFKQLRVDSCEIVASPGTEAVLSCLGLHAEKGRYTLGRENVIPFVSC